MQNLKGKKIRLLVSDIDGTLVPKSKQLTPETVKAAQQLREAGIALSLVSSRPAYGMRMFLDPLRISVPYGALNGGEILDRAGTVLSVHYIASETVLGIYEILSKYAVNIWVFNPQGWFVLNREDPLVAYEEQIVQITAKPLADLQKHTEKIIKIMAISKETDKLRQIAEELNQHYAGQVKAIQSMDHYLDITMPCANKGFVLEWLGQELKIPLDEIAAIGDMDNDIPMFEKAGLAIAMGQSPDKVRQHADIVTKSNEENGWAYAVEHYILAG